MNERKGRVLEALLETVEFAVLSYAMSGAAFALRLALTRLFVADQAARL